MSNRRLIVVKFGTESLGNGNGGVDQDRINGHAERLKPLHDDDNDLLVMTSGAKAEGVRRVLAARQSLRHKSLHQYSDRTLTMLGSAGVSVAWESAFDRVGILAGQVLATHREMHDSQEGPYLKEAYEEARSAYAIPIFNYNDFLSSQKDDKDELKELIYRRDNDRYVKDVAIHLGAEVLFFATNDVEGFMANDELKPVIAVSEIEGLKAHIFEDAGNGMSSGGMDSKLDNAGEAAMAGIETYICNANSDFAAIMAGQQICSRVVQYA